MTNLWVGDRKIIHEEFSLHQHDCVPNHSRDTRCRSRKLETSNNSLVVRNMQCGYFLLEVKQGVETMDKTLDELLASAEACELYLGVVHQKTGPVSQRWAAFTDKKDQDHGVVPVSEVGNTPLAAIQALIIKAKLPIILHKCPY